MRLLDHQSSNATLATGNNIANSSCPNLFPTDVVLAGAGAVFIVVLAISLRSNFRAKTEPTTGKVVASTILIAVWPTGAER
ncbi:hypothetical protein K456DRAFT_1321404 [Colletotrichum gloeosporioides 23]|nr:hypothetical protein K456DRAFT_1321404 [Colletotrichum gloeosporioides 23]